MDRPQQTAHAQRASHYCASPDATSPDPIKLTRKEREVLHWCAHDKSSWEIARILACSEATVNFHVTNIRHKFGVYSRGAAVHQALKMGLIGL